MDIHRCRFVDYTPHTITSIAFSHPSSLTNVVSSELRLAVGRSNGDIEIWNPKYNWTHELTLPGSRGRSIEGLCWAIQDKESPRLFSIGGSTYITEWDLSTGKPVTNYDCNAGIIWSIDVSKNSELLAVGCDDGSVVIVDISGGFGSLEHGFICQRQDSRVLSIKWHENDLLVGGCADARIRCWSARGETRGRLVGTMRVDKSKTESTLVWSVMVLSNHKQIVSGDSTGSIKFWDLETFTLLQNFKVHDADVLCLAKDVSEEKIFSGGVDRKIHQFNLIKTTKSVKWVHSFNRLLHSNDIRSMSVFESKLHNFLISGGVEKSIVIQSVQQFHDGRYRKLTINQQISNTLINDKKKYVLLWQDQTIKIWKITESKHKLISKISLVDDENITSVDLNEDGDLLVVSTLATIKVFQLEETEKKLLVNKIRDDDFISMTDGAKKVKVLSHNKFLILTPDEEIYIFKVDYENGTISIVNEIDTSSESVEKLKHLNCIKNIAISPNQETIAISRYNGSIEIFPLNDGSMINKLTKLYSLPHLINFSSAEKLLVVTEENKIFEFFINSEENGLLTPWSKRNSEFLPKQFLVLDDKAQDIFIKNNKVWIYGSTWVCFFDLSLNIPILKYYQNTSNTKKRNRDGLTIEGTEDISNDIDGSLDIVEENSEILDLSLKQSQINRLRQQIQVDESNNERPDTKPFWITNKYRPIMKVGDFGTNEIIVIERPQFALPTAPAFNLPKLKI